MEQRDAGQEPELLLPAGHLGCALAADSVAVLAQARRAMQLSGSTHG